MKMSLFVNDMIIYEKNLKESIQIVLKPISNYRKVAAYKVNTQKLIAFLYTNEE